MFVKQKVFCPAKINLFLEVLDKRGDGYHNIDSVMQSVNLCDILTVTVNDNTDNCNLISLSITPSGTGIPCDERNTAHRAAKLFLEHYGKQGFDIKIDIEKNIPVEAGLAGGSADAAGVLTALARIFGITGDERGDLLEIGARTGADVPFCMTCGAAHTTGIGDVITRLVSVSPEFTFIIAKGSASVSTSEAYGKIDKMQNRQIRSSEEIRNALNDRDIYRVCPLLYNSFRAVSGSESVFRAESIMLQGGALGALMSGSGPAVFGIFTDIDIAEEVRITLQKEGYEAFMCSPVM